MAWQAHPRFSLSQRRIAGQAFLSSCVCWKPVFISAAWRQWSLVFRTLPTHGKPERPDGLHPWHQDRQSESRPLHLSCHHWKPIPRQSIGRIVDSIRVGNLEPEHARLRGGARPKGAPCNGAAVWANGYLPAVHQGALLRDHGSPILNLQRPEGITLSQQREEFDAIRALNQRHAQARPIDTELEARIQAYELAFRMQQAAPEAVDLSAEPESMQKLYGLDRDETRGFGRQCLLARRMVERGVRFTLLVHGVQIGAHSWDDHSNVEAGMRKHSQEVDQPVSALLEDLHQRGLLEDTLVVWASEMGRTPFVNSPSLPKNPGREHNSYGLCMWMAGGRVRAGATAGETDPFSLRSVGEPIHIRDVHATILHLMGLEDERLTFQHAGRIRKLTDIGGHILHSLIA